MSDADRYLREIVGTKIWSALWGPELERLCEAFDEARAALAAEKARADRAETLLDLAKRVAKDKQDERDAEKARADSLDRQAAHVHDVLQEVAAERDALRAQVATLREALEAMREYLHGDRTIRSAKEEMEAALSATKPGETAPVGRLVCECGHGIERHVPARPGVLAWCSSGSAIARCSCPGYSRRPTTPAREVALYSHDFESHAPAAEPVEREMEMQDEMIAWGKRVLAENRKNHRPVIGCPYTYNEAAACECDRISARPSPKDGR